MTIRSLALLFCFALAACAEMGPATDMRLLAVVDSTYVDAETLQPFTGRVFRTFPGDTTKNEIEGRLLDGEWDGELIVYHPSGRLRYMGSFARGERCGPWTENQDDLDPVTDFRQLVSDIESMGIYPPCPES